MKFTKIKILSLATSSESIIIQKSKEPVAMERENVDYNRINSRK
jgi:hypothetical protein